MEFKFNKEGLHPLPMHFLRVKNKPDDGSKAFTTLKHDSISFFIYVCCFLCCSFQDTDLPDVVPFAGLQHTTTALIRGAGGRMLGTC